MEIRKLAQSLLTFFHPSAPQGVKKLNQRNFSKKKFNQRILL